jgi:hypothetical protein
MDHFNIYLWGSMYEAYDIAVVIMQAWPICEVKLTPRVSKELY